MHHSQQSLSSNSSRWSSAREDAPSPLNLTIHGSPAPRATRPNRRKLSQPPNSPANTITLPIDRIMQLRSGLASRLDDGCSLSSSRSSSCGSPQRDLALDLSSIADSSTESDRSPTASSCDESAWSRRSSSTMPLLPSAYFQPVWKNSVPKRTAPIEASSDRSNGFRSEVSSKGSWRNTCASRNSYGSDLIDVYVETVNNADITRYFRPCATCGERLCQCCPDSNPSRNACSSCNSCYCDCSPPATYSRFLLLPVPEAPHGFQNTDQNDSGNSTLQLDTASPDTAGSNSSGGVLSRQHVSLSVMQLATAAQCARILADSLDSVLELAREELTTDNNQRESVSATSALHQDSLIMAAEALKRPPHDLQSLKDKMSKK